MNSHLPLRIAFGLALGITAGLAGCARAPSGAPAEPPEVTVSHPVEQYVTDF
jgi:type IV pilus biogenesis protein CpaD/CtpE